MGDSPTELDLLFAARSWESLAPEHGPFGDVARVAAHANSMRDSDPPWSHDQPLLDALVDASWLLVSLRHETAALEKGWEPAGHYAVHLAHRALDVLIGAYFGFEFALSHGKWTDDPYAACKHTRLCVNKFIHIDDYLRVLQELPVRKGLAASWKPHPSMETLLSALGGAKGLGLWRTLNERRNEGIMGHGHATLEDSAAKLAKGMPPSGDSEEAQPTRRGSGGGSPRPQASGETMSPRKATGPAPRRQEPPLVKHPLVPVLRECELRLVHVAAQVANLTRSGRFTDELAKSLVAKLDWNGMRYSADQA